MKLLGPIRTITFSVSTGDSLLMLCFSLVRSKLEYSSVGWNIIMIAECSELKCIQKKFTALCQNKYFQDIQYHCDKSI
jgi:hypothetical protein